MQTHLTDYLKQSIGINEDLRIVVESVADACAQISRVVADGALGQVFGSDASVNVHGEDQQKLDLVANRLLTEAAARSRRIQAVASEEEENIVLLDTDVGVESFLLSFDPLDGSSNINVNISIGTIFSILPASSSMAPSSVECFLQVGRNQLVAGYVIYGPQTTMMLATTDGVIEATLHRDSGEWRISGRDFSIPEQTQELSVNVSNLRHWAAPMRVYVEQCFAGTTGPREKDYNMRWTASMVADVNRVLVRGGIFLYPWDARIPARPGKLRLLYEANPISFIVERAGGATWNGWTSILDMKPQSLHQRVQVVLGSCAEVAYLTSLYQAA